MTAVIILAVLIALAVHTNLMVQSHHRSRKRLTTRVSLHGPRCCIGNLSGGWYVFQDTSLETLLMVAPGRLDSQLHGKRGRAIKPPKTGREVPAKDMD